MRRFIAAALSVLTLSACGASASSTTHSTPAATGTVKLSLPDQSAAIARRMRTDPQLLHQLRAGYHNSSIAIDEIDCSETRGGDPYAYGCDVWYHSASSPDQYSGSINLAASCSPSGDCSWKSDLLPGRS